MSKPTKSNLPVGLKYTNDRSGIVQAARGAGMSDRQFLENLTANEYGKKRRRELIELWAPFLGLSVKEALEVAKRAGIIG